MAMFPPGLGSGVMGYGMQFEPRPNGPIVTKIFGGGEAHRTGLIQEGDLLTEVNGASISEDALFALPPPRLASFSPPQAVTWFCSKVWRRLCCLLLHFNCLCMAQCCCSLCHFLLDPSRVSAEGMPFMEVMDSIVATSQCSFTFSSGPVSFTGR